MFEAYSPYSNIRSTILDRESSFLEERRSRILRCDAISVKYVEI